MVLRVLKYSFLLGAEFSIIKSHNMCHPQHHGTELFGRCLWEFP